MAPPANYDAHHADDEAEGAMDKAINSLKNFAWLETELKFWFAQISETMSIRAKMLEFYHSNIFD